MSTGRHFSIHGPLGSISTGKIDSIQHFQFILGHLRPYPSLKMDPVEHFWFWKEKLTRSKVFQSFLLIFDCWIPMSLKSNHQLKTKVSQLSWIQLEHSFDCNTETEIDKWTEAEKEKIDSSGSKLLCLNFLAFDAANCELKRNPIQLALNWHLLLRLIHLIRLVRPSNSL